MRSVTSAPFTYDDRSLDRLERSLRLTDSAGWHTGLVIAAIGQGQNVPIYVPIFFTAWGVLIWVTWARKMWRDPDGQRRAMAEARANTPIIRALGGSSDPEEEYRKLAAAPAFFKVVTVGYSVGVGVAWYAALR
jgi:hypothetical protein